ncbi:hypothetical protein EVAR_9343_1 [Eumeta japonica]|uniref:Uncharacterized protein n=1 Tax=Eumeta variegata TaxID=151549 RepID=A0A4C1YPZ7_EUMVA|nr:hypothetical protein EVAR_9343_1 [Eumeta japonica]
MARCAVPELSRGFKITLVMIFTSFVRAGRSARVRLAYRRRRRSLLVALAPRAGREAGTPRQIRFFLNKYPPVVIYGERHESPCFSLDCLFKTTRESMGGQTARSGDAPRQRPTRLLHAVVRFGVTSLVRVSKDVISTRGVAGVDRGRE